MSLNQSRFDKNESQFRKPGGGRSGTGSGSAAQLRSFPGGRGRGAGPSAAPTTSTNHPRSYKKIINSQGRANAGPLNATEYNAATSSRSVENGAHAQSSLHVSDAPTPAVTNKPADASSQKPSIPIPKPPSSQSSSMSSDSVMPSTPSKGDGAKGFSLQFGSLSPGFMNGMQVPARTSSAPPNIDEQKQDQACRDASRVVPAIPLPSAPKQDLPKKDVSLPKHPVAQENNNKTKRDVHVASAPLPTQAQKPSVLPTPGTSVPMQFHQPSISMQFAGPNQQIPSQGMSTSTLQMPIQMPLLMGNPSQVPQQVFMPGLQHPIMQSQGIMHHGQNLGFSTQIAPQLSHQLGGNMGMSMPTQYNQPQVGKFGSTRKTVKITHPETHEELRLDSRDGGSSTSGAHPSGAPSQSQPGSAYPAAHAMGYYSNSYATGPPFFPAQSSLPLTSAQLNATSQGPRFNYTGSQAPPTMPFMNQPASITYSVNRVGAPVHGTSDSSNLNHVRDSHTIASSAQVTSVSVTVKAVASSSGEKVINSSVVEKPEPVKISTPAVEPSGVSKDLEVTVDKSSVPPKPFAGHPKHSAVMTDSVASENSSHGTGVVIPATVTRESSATDANAYKGETIVKSMSIRDVEKLTGKKGQAVSSSQVDGHSDSSACQDSECAEAKPKSGPKVLVSEAGQVSPANASCTATDVTSYSSEAHTIVDKVAKDQHEKPCDLPLQESSSKELTDAKERGEIELEEFLSDDSLKSMDITRENDQDGQVRTSGNVGSVVEASQGQAASANSSAMLHTVAENDSTVSDGCSVSDSITLSGITDSCIGSNLLKSEISDNETTSVSPKFSDAHIGHDGEGVDIVPSSSGSSSGASKLPIEANKTKKGGKKKLKEVLQKADAQGTTADLYMAYKGPEVKKETDVTSVIASEDNSEISGDAKLVESTIMEKVEQNKTELDDWEDAAESSTPKLESSVKDARGISVLDEESVTVKKYSRDFLLTFKSQCTDLPEGFEITSDIDALMSVHINASRIAREIPSPGRITDRSVGANRPDRRGVGTMDLDRWSKQPIPFSSVRDPGIDLAYVSNMMGFRGGQGPSYGVLKNPRSQGPVPLAGGILSGPVQSMGFQGIQRNNSDADRWQRATNFNKGLMPPPQGPAQVMHKAEKKYEIGKISDEEQAKQRKLKSILNKLTPQNFEKLFEQVKEVNIDNAVTLTGVISQIFDKALMEPTFCEMYANFCQHLASELPELSVDNEKITFRRLLLNKCQEEFERGEREEQEANKAANEGEDEAKQSEEQREEMRLKARRRMLGNIRLIGELYKKRMLTERIMHECIKKLLGQNQNPDEENIEALCKLMSTIGEMIDHPKAKEHMDAYFDIMGQLSNNMNLSSRVRFMLKDAIDLRKNKWQQRRKVEGPKKIEEVHRDAAQERQGQVGRLSRGPSMNSTTRRGQPMDFGPRGTVLPSQIGQVGGFRGIPSQARGYGGLDVRTDDRGIFESRPHSVTLPQMLSSDELTLGPQGGLARVFRGQPSMSSSPLLDNSPSYVDSRRMVGGLNGYSNVSQRGPYYTREDHFTNNAIDRFGAPIAIDQSSSQDVNTSRDAIYSDHRARSIVPPVARAASSQNIVPERVLPEDRLQQKSIAAIREYYSAKDDKEVAVCISDLNAPSFYPTVVSIWVTDSFERKDLERDMLSKLLVNLARPREGIFSPGQLIEGFKSVLTNLEDTVTDAPRAPEFLGRIFARVIIENVLRLNEIGKLVYDGGEEPGCLREAGLAADIIGSVLENIKSERGESVLNEIRASSNLRLEDFRPPGSIRSRKLEMFM